MGVGLTYIGGVDHEVWQGFCLRAVSVGLMYECRGRGSRSVAGLLCLRAVGVGLIYEYRGVGHVVW